MNNFDDLLTNNQLLPEEYSAMKKAEREDIFSLSDQTAVDVVSDSHMFQPFLDLQARIDRYSAVNTLLVFAQDNDASRLGSFDYWKKLNCPIASGETAISIIEPHAYTKEDGTQGTGYNVKKVFDISQVDTQKLAKSPTPSYSDRQLLGALVARAPMKITGVDELPDDLGAMTNPETGEISVLKGMDFPDTFRIVAQELASADLSKNAIPQAEPVFSAYCASYLLCKKYGVDTKDFSFTDAPKVFEGMDAQEIKGELSQIRDTAEKISSRMSQQLEQQAKAAKAPDAR